MKILKVAGWRDEAQTIGGMRELKSLFWILYKIRNRDQHPPPPPPPRQTIGRMQDLKDIFWTLFKIRNRDKQGPLPQLNPVLGECAPSSALIRVQDVPGFCINFLKYWLYYNFSYRILRCCLIMVSQSESDIPR